MQPKRTYPKYLQNTWPLLGIGLLLAGCGGGGGGSEIPAGPAITSVTAGKPSNGQIVFTASAANSSGGTVSGYCFKTSATAPQASDACFSATPSTTISLPQTDAVYVWAKDTANRIGTAAFAGCSANGLAASKASALPTVCVSTSLGEWVAELEPNKAPTTTANFLKYVNDGYYSQTVFHRVVANFVIQAGAFTGVPISDSNAKAGTTYPAIALEAPAITGLSNTAGTLAMARSGSLNSATNQFFINVVDNTGLNTSNGGYAVFGRVISGLDSTVQAIRNVAVQANSSNELSQPITPPVITWAYPLK